MVYKPTFTSLRGAQAAFRRQGGGDWWPTSAKNATPGGLFSVYSDFRIDFGVENGG